MPTDAVGYMAVPPLVGVRYGARGKIVDSALIGTQVSALIAGTR